MTPLLAQGTLAALATIGAALIAAFAGYIAVRSNNRTKRLEIDVAAQGQQAAERGQVFAAQQNSYDQLQDDVTSLRAELAALKKSHGEEIAVIRADLAKSLRRERILEAHTWQLRRHIEQELGPPPPEWPAGLEGP